MAVRRLNPDWAVVFDDDVENLDAYDAEQVVAIAESLASFAISSLWFARMDTMAKKRERRTYAAILLDKLRELGGDEIRINNQTLRYELGWEEEEDRYRRVKETLIEQGYILTVPGGPGGALILASGIEPETVSVKPDFEELNQQRPSINIFISYCHADAVAKTELVRQLNPLTHVYSLKIWDDGLIEAGTEWNKVIRDRLETSDIILLLVSVDFINSKYCLGVELKRALERHVDKKSTVIPVIMRDCFWKIKGLQHLQALPAEARPIANWPNKDAAYLDVATKIEEILNRLTR
jgi:TIR domain